MSEIETRKSENEAVAVKLAEKQEELRVTVEEKETIVQVTVEEKIQIEHEKQSIISQKEEDYSN